MNASPLPRPSRRSHLPRVAAVVAAALIVAVPRFAPAQTGAAEPARPAFSLGSSHMATTKERPAITLTFRRVEHLDFRVYRVKDALQFFALLRDPHVLGSEEPIVPQEQTWLERIATWKADRRDGIRSFVRRQFSPAYRARRRQRTDQAQVQLRRIVRYGTFAQVPLLNASQLVSSWREILPPVKDTEARRIPLDLPEPGVYVVEAVHAPLRAYTVVIVSDIGLVTKTAPGQVLLYAANRFSGEPEAGCDVHTIADRQAVGTGVTGADGTYELRLDQQKIDDIVAVARCRGQVAATAPGTWALSDSPRELAGYVYTDKPIYRPGHTVRIKGVLRWRAKGTLLPFDRKSVELAVTDPNDKVLLRQVLPVDEFGAVHASFPVPRGASLGDYRARLASDDQQAHGAFEVQEYRKPEFEVVVTPAERFVLQGAPARVTLNARYYFGQPVAGGAVQYVVHRQPYYSPLRWVEDGEEDEYGSGWWGGEEERQGTARLDDRGIAEIALPTGIDSDGQDYSWRIEARVADASSREVAGNTTIHATWGRFLLAARADRYVHAPGSEVTFRVRALDYAGVPQPNVRLTVSLDRVSHDTGRWREPTYTRIADGSASTDAEGRGTWTTTLPAEPGQYRLMASAASGSRVVRDDVYVWIPGRGIGSWDEERVVELVADSSSYQPGDTARLTIQGGQPASAILVTKEKQDVSYRRVIRLANTEAIEVPIAEDDLGDTYLNIVFLKDDRLYRAEKRLRVPATSKQLQVAIVADQAVARPRQSGGFSIRVTDAAGQPARAQLSVGVIDEAVYGVKPDSTVDPLRFFYRTEYSQVITQFSREYSFVGYSGTEQLQLAGRRRPMGLADFKADRPAQPQVRKDFPDAIYWLGDVVTDAAGAAHVDVPYPDSLTTWRLTARAVTADTRVGAAIARTTTTKDLIVRVVTPRFLTEGDEAAVPVIVHSYLAGPKSVAVSFQAPGVGLSAGPPGPAETPEAPRTLSIEQGGEQRLDWRVRADKVGTAAFTGTAVTDTDTDAVEVTLPVLPFGLKRQAAASGSRSGPGEQVAELTVPDTANPAARAIRVSLAPSLAGPLLGALDFLTSYPYGCTEQTLSSFLPNLMVLRALADLKLAPTERLQALDRQVTDGLRRLYDYQHDEGGWGWWKTDQSSPFMTAYALYGLLEARHAGYKVDEWRLRNGARSLMTLYASYPRAVPDLKVYMVYVLGLAERADALPRGMEEPESYRAASALDEAWAARDRMSAYGQALLLLTLDGAKDPRGDELAAAVVGRAQRKGDLAWWVSAADPLLEDAGDTGVEATALTVKALAARDPNHALLEPAVRWLLLNRNYGAYWSSTKQTAMVLLGLLDYMRARAEAAVDTTVEVFVNGEPVGRQVFTPASLTSPDPVVVTAPARAGLNTIRLVTKGTGTLYWSATAEYFDQSGPLERTGSRKLALVRTYLALTPVRKSGRIVYRETPFAGTAKPGDLLLVRLAAAGSTDWRYLIIEDPLPAGVETVQQRELYELEKRQAFWDGSRREYRDDRVVFFQESFSAGRYEYVYLLKVTTPGTFRAMPARISAMYVPEADASSGALTVTVEAEAGRSNGLLK